MNYIHAAQNAVPEPTRCPEKLDDERSRLFSRTPLAAGLSKVF